MLLNISIRNFLSIAETQSLNLVADKTSSKQDSNVIPTGLKALPGALRTAAIYGPNASGKSSIVKAVDFMVNYILKGSHKMQEGDIIRVKPFKFSEEYTADTSEFEVTFVQNGVRYQYGFAANRDIVAAEWLFAFPHTKPQRWFERSYNFETQTTDWYFGSKLQGHKSLWRDSTRSNALFLSTAVQLNSDQLKPIFDWFNRIQVVPADQFIASDYTRSLCETETGRKNVTTLLAFADQSIKEIKFEKIEPPKLKFPDDVPDSLKNMILEDVKKGNHERISLLHTPTNNSKESKESYIDFNDESSGTKMLFNWAGPWIDILTSGRIAFIDELETSLHSQLLIFLIDLINSKEANKSNGQLVFTTHDTVVLQKKGKMRKDQFWFVEKNDELASILYPLTDFKPREGEALQKGYLQGRYGAIPYTDTFNFNISVNVTKNES